MAFEKGHKLAKGRPPGSLNRRSVHFYEVLQEEGFDPARELITIYREAKKIYDSYGTIYEALEEARERKGINPYPTEDKADKYLKIAMDCAKEIASYAYPKLKAVEQKKVSISDTMTPHEKLEALKQAIKQIEAEAKNESKPE